MENTKVDAETKRSRSVSRSRSRSRSRSPMREASRSRSHSRSRSRSPPRSRSRSRSRSPRRDWRRSPSPFRPRPPRGPLTHPKADPSNVLGVFGLSHYTRTRTLEDLFRKYGPLKDCKLVVDRRSGQSRGFGFIYFETIEDATKALEATNGMNLDGRSIRVDYSATQKAHEPTPGVYMGEKRDRSPYRRGGYRDSRDRRDHYSRRSYRSRSRSPAYRRSRSRSRDRYYSDRNRRYSRSRSR